MKNNNLKKLGRIGVLMGGPSTEREISLKSGRAVLESLRELNLDSIGIDIKTDSFQENQRLIKAEKIDCAFLALHGYFGEDGKIQELLDSLGVVYTGSGTLSSKLTMDKIISRKILEIYGLPVPKYLSLEKNSYNANQKISIIPPLVVKPASQGSSIGVTIVRKQKDLSKALDQAFSFVSRLIVEEYIDGREMTVGILDNKALPVIEVIPKKGFFDFKAKYKSGCTEYIVPAKIEKEKAKKIQTAALSAHRLLGCSGCSRVDIILKDDTPFILEVNSIPGMTKVSLLPKAARVEGIDFSKLCLKLIELAYEKKQN